MSVEGTSVGQEREGARDGRGSAMTRSVRVSVRDERVLEWLGLVRISSVEGLRWVLGALNGSPPVGVRAVQHWCARMEGVGLVERARVWTGGGALVWPTRAASGRSPVSLLRVTTRHEVAVSVVSARYVASGWSWDRDRRPEGVRLGHVADGAAFRDGRAELAEVELTPKQPDRYQRIFAAFAARAVPEGVTAIRYFATGDAARAVLRAVRAPGCPVRDLVSVHEVFDRRGRWEGDELPSELVETPAVGGEL